MTIRVLHLIDQLTRGGAGRALLGVAGASRDLHHTIGSLRPPEEGARRLAAEAGIEVLHLREEAMDAAEDRRGCEASGMTIAAAHHPTIAEANRPTITDAIDAADIVHVHFWNNPSLYRALGRPWPAARVLLWCHVGGDEPPQVLTAGLVDFSDVILASNPHTAELPVLARANTEGKGGMVLGTADFSRLRTGLARSNPRFTITHIGTIDFVKMHPDFVALHAGLDIDDYRVVVCGDGAALPILRRQAAEAGCADRFEFRGYVEAIDEVFAESDIFAYPIGDGYASELVLQEAMFCGVPPVVMTTGGPTRMVLHEDTGLLARTASEYRSALERLAKGPGFRVAMSARAATYAREHWGAERSAAQLVGWYKKLMGAPKRLRPPLGGGEASCGADRFLLGLGASASQFCVSRNAQDHPRATVLAADRLIAASSPLLASGASGGVLHYRLEYPGDPLLHYWSGLILVRAGRPALAAAEFAAARRVGFDASRLDTLPGQAGTAEASSSEADPPGVEVPTMNNNKPLRVSVVMAVWNAERFLEEALASIAAQTFPPAEVLLVDGGSTDATLAIASRFEWVRCFPQRGRGLSDAWNTGVHASSGDAIAFLDSDDHWVPDKLRLQAEHLNHNPDADAVIGKVHFFLQEGEAPPPGFRTSLLEGSHLAAMPGTTLLRRAAFDRVGDFDVGLNVATDIEWYARARDRGLRMDPLQEVLLHKRVHGGNFSYTSARSDNYERDLLRAIHRLRVERRRPPTGEDS